MAVRAGRVAVLVGFVSLGFIGPSSAADIFWAIPGAGDWNVANNWSGSVIPSTGDDVFITNPSASEVVNVPTGATINRLQIGANSDPNSVDQVILSNNTTFTLHGGGFVNGGIFRLDSTGHNTNLIFNGDQTIASAPSAAGRIVLSDRTTNRIYTLDNVLTHASGHTIEGAGQLLVNSGGLVNHSGANILATGQVALTIDPNLRGVTNLGTLAGEGSGGLILQGGAFTNHGGLIEARTASKVRLSGATVAGGTIRGDGSGVVTATASTFDAVTIDGTFDTPNNTTNTFVNGLTLNGTMSQTSAGHNTDLRFLGDQTIAGAGEIILGDRSTNRLRSDGSTLTIGSDITVRGAGQILVDSGGIINLGTIRAQGSSPLILDFDTLGFENHGQLVAEGSGGLRLQFSTFTLGTTSVDVLPGSQLATVGAEILGGRINVDPSASAAFTASILDAVTVNGTIVQNNNTSNRIKTGLTLNGTWELNSTGHNTDLIFEGPQSLNGNGTVALGNQTTNRLRTNDTLTLGNGITVRGAGQLGANSGGIINQGVIRAEGSKTLVLDVDGRGFLNQGTVEAAGSGGLVLQNSDFDFAGTSIDVLAGSKLSIVSSTINDAVLDIDANGSALARATNFDNLTVAAGGAVDQTNNSSNTFTNGMQLDGTWRLNSTGHNTNMIFAGSQTVSGNGEIVMGDRATNRIHSGSGIDRVLTIDTGVTVRGSGQLMVNSGGLVNHGALIAEGDQQLVIDVDNNGLVNTGTIAANGTGGLRIQGSEVHLGTTSLDIASDSRLELALSTVHGGQINIGASATPNATVSFSHFDDTVFNGVVTQNNNTTNTLHGGVQINGAWILGSSGHDTNLLALGNQTIGGSGEIRFGDRRTNRFRSDDSIITIGTDLTLRGAGQILVNSGGMVNQGTLHADSDAVAMVIDPNAKGFENQGLLLADGSAGMSFIGGYVQTAGRTRANSTLMVVSGSAQIQGGILEGTGTIVGDVEVSGGTVNPGNSPGQLTIDGAFDIGGTGTFLVEIAAANDFDQLMVTETATLGGTIDVDLLGYVPTTGQTFDVLSANLISGTFDNSIVDAGNATFAVNIIGDQLVQLTVVSAVPLPPAIWMLGSTLVALASVRRLRRQS